MSVRIEQIGDCTLYHGDCREVMASWPECFRVDAVVTSPPYDNIREYGDGFHSLDWISVIKIISQKLSLGGVMVWNVADQVVEGSETGTSFRQALLAMECGLRLHDTMIYCKECVTFPNSNRYHPAFEYMFVFSNGAPKVFNGIKDWPNKWAGTKVQGTNRLADGSTRKTNGTGKDVRVMGLRRNWWVISNPYTGETGGHPAPMPYSLASDHIETWTEHGDTILDPFMGSGTTGVACVKLDRKFIGIELEPKYFDIACRRIEAAYKEPRLPLERPKPKQERMEI